MQTELPKQAASAMPVLRVIDDSEKARSVKLDRAVCVVGRQEPAHLALGAKQVSKVHALLLHYKQRVYLRDLASTNGVQLNGSTVREAGLADHDQVRIGSFTLRCESGFGEANGERAASGLDASDASDLPAAELRGEAGTMELPRDRRTFLIGRRGGCELRLDHPSVAPVHAIVYELAGQRFIYDLNSPGRIKLNGETVRRSELKPGDELTIGEVALRYVLSEEEVSRAPVQELEESLDVLVDDAASPALEAELVDSAGSIGHDVIEIGESSVGVAAVATEPAVAEQEIQGQENIAPEPAQVENEPVESESSQTIAGGEKLEEFGLSDDAVAVDEINETPVELEEIPLEGKETSEPVEEPAPAEPIPVVEEEEEFELDQEAERSAEANIDSAEEELPNLRMNVEEPKSAAMSSAEEFSDIAPLVFTRDAEMETAPLSYEDFDEQEEESLDWESAGMVTMEEDVGPVKVIEDAPLPSVVLRVVEEPGEAVADAEVGAGPAPVDQAATLREAVKATIDADGEGEQKDSASKPEVREAVDVPTEEEISAMLASVIEQVERLQDAWAKFHAYGKAARGDGEG